MLQLNHLNGFSVASAGGLKGGQFVDSDVNASSGSSFTFSSMSFGESQSNRYIIVSIAAEAGNSTNVSTVTIGGVSASYAHRSSTNAKAEIWVALVPTGTTGDVIVTWAGNQDECSVAAYSFYGLSSTTPSDTFSRTNTGSGTIDVPAGGCIIGVCSAGNSASTVTISWTGSTADATENPNGAPMQHSSSFDESAATITVTGGGSISGANHRVFAAAAFV